MSQRVLIAGVGMTPFVPLGAGESTAVLAGRAIRLALDDARIDYDLVDQVFAACVSGAVGCSEEALAETGLTGIPVFTVRDGCVAATSAFQLARHSVLCGEAECALVLGFESMPANVSNRAFFGLDDLAPQAWGSLEHSDAALAFLARRQQPAALFAAQTSWLLTRMGVAQSSFEQVLSQARTQASVNPLAVLNHGAALDGWLAPYLCPPACGAAAVLLCSPAFLARYGARGGVAVLSSVRGSDTASEQESGCVLDVLGRAATRRVAQQAYELAGLGADEIEVVELHDQSVGDFMVYSAALGLCEEDQIDTFVRERRNVRGAQVAICASGGLLGRGHAPGATGLAQIAELVWQLRGTATHRQRQGARTALQHSAALGRAVAVTILQRT
ncbi:MAG TPA: acetyl-CoA acetyltransferase [Pseudomonas sp.]|nr:acetyl-CoA acetyltransferase [Pseudomonas sp.]